MAVIRRVDKDRNVTELKYDYGILGNKTPKGSSQEWWNTHNRDLHSRTTPSLNYNPINSTTQGLASRPQAQVTTTPSGSAGTGSQQTGTLTPVTTGSNHPAYTQPTQASQVNRFQYAPNVNTSWYRQNLQPIQTTSNYFDKFNGYNNYKFGGNGYSPQQSLLTLLNSLGIGGGQPEGIGGGTGGSNDVGLSFQDWNANINGYIDELIAEAQGQRDLIVKQLDAQHQLALGTDDKARAEFIEKVADKLEERIGRIPYDYEKYSTRELEDFARTSQRLTESKDTALGRLYEDEKLQGEDLTRQIDKAREQQGANLTERGILEGTRNDAQGVAGKQVQDLEGDAKRQFEALARATGRSEYDTNLQFNQGMENALRTRDRNLSDITTSARREGIDAQQLRDFGVEKADFNLNSQKTKLERQRNMSLQNAGATYTNRLPQ